MKLDVEKNLPPKEEIIVDVELTNLQKGCVRDAVCACVRACVRVGACARACVRQCVFTRTRGRTQTSQHSARPPAAHCPVLFRSRMRYSEYARLLARRYYRAIYERNREFLTTSVGGAFGL
jgi:hypothetical protein